MENKKLDFTEKTHFYNEFLRALEKCPHVIKNEIGGEEFAKVLIKGTEILTAFFKPASN
jgi:hypothetical protein